MWDLGLLGILNENLQAGLILIVTLVFSLSFHEFAHAYTAYKLGDNTSAHQGRLTLNPAAHLDPFGSLMLLLVGFGYAKPVPVNPINLNNPRTDMMKIAFAGPASNLILCLIGCLVIRLVGSDEIRSFVGFNKFGPVYNYTNLGMILVYFSNINMLLAIFNLIPVHPLDGGQIFGGFLDKRNPGLSYKLRAYGPRVLMGVIFFGIFTGKSIIGLIISPFQFLVSLISGLY